MFLCDSCIHLFFYPMCCHQATLFCREFLKLQLLIQCSYDINYVIPIEKTGSGSKSRPPQCFAASPLRAVLCITIMAALCSSGCVRVVHPGCVVASADHHYGPLHRHSSYAKQVGEMAVFTQLWGCYCGDNYIIMREEQTVTKSKNNNYPLELVNLQHNLTKDHFASACL